MEELKRIIDDSEITKEDDALWPPPDRVGRQVSVLAAIHSTEILQIRWGLLLCILTLNPLVYAYAHAC